ncbi:hypothetical protein MNAN1_002591 [Malassezia nana]|uniref:RNA-binding protein n=1 Tax=Malassezia nana TaxID=180528 RepID=A0AAF0J2Y5_9BASI|nr:hypothetical protein MNAN1_002591 [Malassezia nana]
MLFPQEEAPAVKQWLVRELEPLCDADPDVLADYVLALFKNDANEAELVAMLNEQLADFLEQHTQAFVSKTVEALKRREHVAVQTRKREADDEGAPEETMTTDDNNAHTSKRQALADDAMDEGETREMSQARPRSQRFPKGKCRDYHSTLEENELTTDMGVCSRGNTCKFQHSDDSIMAPFPMPGMPFMPPPFPMGPDGQMPPELAQMMPPPEQMAEFMQQMAAMSGQMQPPFMTPQRGRGRGRGRGGSMRGFQGHAPVARSQDTLVVENIPPECLNLVQVNDYFKRFGTITNIEMDEPGKRAIVTYATPAEASEAHKNPDVIFGNRFVKVYFQRIERPPPSKPNYMTDKGSNVYLAPELRSAAPARPNIDDEKRRVLELRKKRESLVHMQLAEQKALLEKLESKDLTPQGRSSIMSMLQKLSEEIKAATESLKKDVSSETMSTDGPTTEELQAKLAKLRSEAASLGLDPSGHPAPSGSFRGSFRGRGFRGAMPIRGRGRGGFNRSMTLDNRTTKVGVSGLPENFDMEKLREHMQSFGEYTSIEPEGDQVVVTYKTRASGERAMRAAGSVPDASQASFQWVDVSIAPTTATDPVMSSDGPETVAELDESVAERENWKR